MKNNYKLFRINDGIIYLVRDGQEVPLFIGELHTGLSDGLHGGGHVVVPGRRILKEIK